jgi:hypothetical protein
MIPELLEANQLLASDPPEAISFELTGHREESRHTANAVLKQAGIQKRF